MFLSQVRVRVKILLPKTNLLAKGKLSHRSQKINNMSTKTKNRRKKSKTATKDKSKLQPSGKRSTNKKKSAQNEKIQIRTYNNLSQ